MFETPHVLPFELIQLFFVLRNQMGNRRIVAARVDESAEFGELVCEIIYGGFAGKHQIVQEVMGVDDV